MEKQPNSYKFLERVANELMNNIHVSPPDEEHGDTDYDFWFGFDENNSIHYSLSKDDIEKIRENYQPLVALTRDMVRQTLNDFFIIFEDHYGYYNLEDIINVLARFFIPKFYNKYIKEDDTPDAPIVMRESMRVDKKKELTPFLKKVLRRIVVDTNFVTTEFDQILIEYPDGISIAFNLSGTWDKLITPPHSLKKYLKNTYGITEKESVILWYHYKEKIKELYGDYKAQKNKSRMEESKNMESLIDKVVRDIEKNFNYGEESIDFNTVDYGFRDRDLSRSVNFYYDPYHSNIGKFDYEFVLSTISNLVAYYLYKTMGIGTSKRLSNRNYDDPMVKPIATKLTQNAYQIAKDKEYIKELTNHMSSLKEQTAPQIRQNVGKIYHKNGFINRIVTDILKMTLLRSFKVLFDFNGLGFTGGHNLPQLLYRWDDNLGLTEDSINVLRRNIPELVKQYLKKQSLLSGDDDPTVPIISEILSDEIIEQINNYQRDEDWEHWNEEWILAEDKKQSHHNKQKQFIDKVKEKVIKSISEDDRFWNFNDMIEPTYDDNVAPVRLQKNGILNNLNGDWLFDRFRDYYGGIYGLNHSEVEEIYNAALYHIFKTSSLNAMNSILIGDWDLEYTPSLIIRQEDWGSYLTRDYDLSKIEDYMDMIEWSRYDAIDYLGAGSHSKFFRGGKAYDVTLKDEKYTDGWTKEDFKPYHEDLIYDMENHHGQQLT
tara:strand:- start:572 stop:2710 length:2139 start_codon:yes stop_codon:yes gene_type:complete